MHNSCGETCGCVHEGYFPLLIHVSTYCLPFNGSVCIYTCIKVFNFPFLRVHHCGCVQCTWPYVYALSAKPTADITHFLRTVILKAQVCVMAVIILPFGAIIDLI